MRRVDTVPCWWTMRATTWPHSQANTDCKLCQHAQAQCQAEAQHAWPASDGGTWRSKLTRASMSTTSLECEAGKIDHVAQHTCSASISDYWRRTQPWAKTGASSLSEHHGRLLQGTTCSAPGQSLTEAPCAETPQWPRSGPLSRSGWPQQPPWKAWAWPAAQQSITSSKQYNKAAAWISQGTHSFMFLSQQATICGRPCMT